ncbi:MAG: RNA pseudouridine synthase [Bdellovibrionales bacterium]|nr:RNA pseudouridine synthase [Bdellovibrionales bacterium]
MEFIEFQWLKESPSHKTALQEALNCSGQLLKKHFSSKELSRPIRVRDISRLPLDLVNHLKINPVFKGPKPFIIKETEDYLVLHKPSGVHSHPHCYTDQDTLLNFLASIGYLDILKVNEGNYDRGLLFRLDYETSGIMIMAKNEKYFAQMRLNFKDKMKRKLYWAIVDGDFDQAGSWIHYFRATGVKGAKQKVDHIQRSDADVGELEVRKIMTVNDKSLVLVNLNSGLRHQIRGQLAALGFPILGDELYGGKQAERLYLHAWRYEWDEIEEDTLADLFDRFFDLNRSLQMSHDMLSVFKSR